MVELMLEICPPSRNADLDKFYRRIASLIRKIKTISIPSKPDCAGEGGFERAFRFVRHLREKKSNIDILFHVTCYDLNRENIRNRLELLRSVGVKDILVITGDNYQLPTADKNLYFANSSQLLQFILNECNWTDSVAVGAYPENSFDEEFCRLSNKIKSVHHAIYTQCIFDVARFKQFVEYLRKHGVGNPIVPSIALFRDKLSLENCCKLARVEGNKELEQALAELSAQESETHTQKYLARLCKELSFIATISRINICTFGQYEMAESLIDELKKSISTEVV